MALLSTKINPNAVLIGFLLLFILIGYLLSSARFALYLGATILTLLIAGRIAVFISEWIPY